MKGFIYKITNKVNGKSYIGQTRYTVEFRWRQHQHKHDNTHFHNAIAKWGADNFIVETLEQCNIEDMDSREIYYIAKFDTYNNGYNSSTGGDGMRGHSRILTDDKYDEIKGLYLSGFSSTKIAALYQVDKATILKLLKAMGVKLRSRALNINKQELAEVIAAYESGVSLKELGRRYDCSGVGMKDFLVRNGVKIREKQDITKDEDQQMLLVEAYKNGTRVDEIIQNFHCSYNALQRILSENGVQRRRTPNMTEEQLQKIDELLAAGLTVPEIASELGYDKSAIYNRLRKRNDE